MSHVWAGSLLLMVRFGCLGLALPAHAQDFSFSQCMAAGYRSNTGAPTLPRSSAYAPSSELACLKAHQENEARRVANEAAQRERQRQAEEAARQQLMETMTRDAADQAAAKEQSRARDEAERARKAEEVEAARQRRARREAELSRPETPPPAAQQLVPGPCVTADLTAKCAMPQDPVLEQIRKSQDNAARSPRR